MLKKTWFITGEITQQDFEWILRSKLDFKSGEQHYMDFIDLPSKNPVKVASKLDPSEIITTTDKEETWFKLYFADRLILYTEDYLDDRFLPLDHPSGMS